MARFFKKTSPNVGTPPGTLTFVGGKKMTETKISVIDFDLKDLDEKKLNSVEDILAYKENTHTTWVNVEGLHDVQLISGIGEMFELSSLLLEDIVNTAQRPKWEEYDNCDFIVLKMLRLDATNDVALSEQVSIIITEKLLLTFQEETGDVFDPVRSRIRNKRKRIRGSGVDFLAYSLVDTIIDNYIKILEVIGEKIENNEAKLIDDPGPQIVENINAYKLEVNYLRKAVRPVKELITQWGKTESDLIHQDTFQYLRDLNDHITSTNEALDSYRDILSDQLMIYHTNLSSKMNDIMRVLTIFAAIFIPLTFIAGVYGTNFEYLPELEYKYSYPIFWGVLLVVAGVMIRYFWKKDWL